jgi:hypothetical protein
VGNSPPNRELKCHLGREQGVPMALGREPKKAGPWAQRDASKEGFTQLLSF